ncbi:hypothetical protein J2R99_000079 [Rhodopseudomonas julia]|uniref:YaaC-like Protein n=1 Tax=Rhodopseudomonas julia TaxID=200617 RepID=A0ABU0C3G4_9BRAD|nr:YaaC family protein [Rhodopseudomonas julia]MDQ0324230.1 hypothetical protein [Rhodopseudomonas julia]
MSDIIRISDRPVRFHRATCDPDFSERRVIASSPWEFVSLWLRKNGNAHAKVYWEQARHFFESARELPVQSAPLPLYYSFLNAVKALLETKEAAYNPYHGVAGFDMRAGGRVLLDNEGIKIRGAGLLPSLISYFQETETDTRYSLSEVLSNLAFIHRAFTISYRRRELFLSIHEPRYVKAEAGRARFQATLPDEHTHGQTINTIPAAFAVRQLDDEEDDDGWGDHVIESVETFAWSGARRPTAADLIALTDFHRNLRRDVNYISGTQPFWYIKRNLAAYRRIERNNLVLILMAMHRMSEISRYKPTELNNLLKGPRNWIVYEFVRGAQNQFIDEIAAEITGYEISPAGVRQSTF